MPAVEASGTVLSHAGLLAGAQTWGIVVLLLALAACVLLAIGVRLCVKAPLRLPQFPGHRRKKTASRR